MRSLLCLTVVFLPALLSAQIEVNFTRMNVSCFGQCNGWAAATASGGTAPYNFQWSNGMGNDTITGLCAGVYTVTVTDAAQNSVVDSVNVMQPFLPLSVSVTTTPQICDIAPDGTALAGPEGGTPPYTYLWNNGMTADSITGLSEGVYTVTVTDINGCTASGQDTVFFWPEGIWLGIKPKQIACFGDGNGSVQAIPMTGTPPYNFVWNTGNSLPKDSIIFNLGPGTYTVTVTDANGCSNTASATITEPPVLDATVTTTPAFCGKPGSATVIPSGGTPPYSVLWSLDSMTTFTISTPAGQVNVVVTDSNGCTFVAGLTIPGNNDTLAITGQILNNAGCNIGGSATLTVGKGSGSYSFLWNTPKADTLATVSNIPAGTYTVTVTDISTGCTGTATVVIPAAPELKVDAITTTAATCLAGATVTATISGGTPPYILAWSNDSTTTTLTGLTPGIYTILVTDSTGCTALDSLEVLPAPVPTVAAQVNSPANCIGGGGSATATPAGGTAPYTFTWSGLPDTTAGITNKPAGTYTVTLSDANSCTATSSVTISQIPSPSVSIIASTNVTCTILGSATAAATGGTSPYTYAWGAAGAGPTISNLAVGTYTVTATDAGGCTGTASVTITLTPDGGNLGDFVWFDNDQDGFQHPIETGVPNIAVALLQAGPDNLFGTADDITVANTTTDAAGKYQFACAAAGTYVIKYSGLPAGYQFSQKDKVNNDCKDSDAKANGLTDPFTILPGQGDFLCVDAGIHIVCENVTNAGLICCHQTICEGETPALIYELQAPAGGSGALEFVWMQLIQMGPGLPTWVAIPGATQANYQPGPLFETASFMRCARRQGCTTFLESNIITVTVLPAGSPGCDPFAGNFTVNALNTATVMVEWTTEPEMLQYLYTVERSADKNHWTGIEKMMGYQDAAAPNHYNTMDHAPLEGMNFYRIRRTADNGAESVSEVREIEMKVSMDESLAVYPNPVTQTLNIRNLMIYDTDAQVELFTAGGAWLHTLEMRAGTQQSFELPVGHLPQGIYLVRLRVGNGNVTTLKVSKM
jgi:hypothetical protein